MTYAQLHGIPKGLRSLGVVGSTAGSAIFFMLPTSLKVGFAVHDFVLVGAAFAALIYNAAVSIAPTGTYYRRHLQLSFEVWIGWMTLNDATSHRTRLQIEHYLPNAQTPLAQAPLATSARGTVKSRSHTGASASSQASLEVPAAAAA